MQRCCRSPGECCELRREEIIAAIGRLGVGASSQARLDEFRGVLRDWHTDNLMKWKNSWARKAVLIGMFGPLVIGLGMFRSWGRNPLSLPFQSTPWLIFLLPVWIIVFAWLHNRMKPKFTSNELGMDTKCVECKYDLSGFDSVLGDEVWVGPATCPECGQDYPAVCE